MHVLHTLLPDALGNTKDVLRDQIFGAKRTPGLVSFSGFANARLSSDVGTALLTAQNITGLSFAIGASEVWSFEVYIKNNKSALTAGIKYAISVPGGGTLQAHIEGTVGALTAATWEGMTASGTLTTAAYNTQANVDGFARIAGVVVASATPGTVQIQHASVTSGTATARANSYITARKIA